MSWVLLVLAVLSGIATSLMGVEAANMGGSVFHQILIGISALHTTIFFTGFLIARILITNKQS